MSRSTILKAAIASLSFVAAASAAPIIVDIGATSSPGNRAVVPVADGSQDVAWNQIANGSTSTPSRNTIANLVDTSNAPTGIALNVLNVTSGPTVGSTTSSTTDFTATPGAPLFSTAMMQSFIAVFNHAGNIDYALTGLDPAATYDFDFLCNRNGTAGTTVITLAGLTSTVGSIATSNNTSLLSFAGVAPDVTGQIVVYVSSPTASSLYAPLNVFQFEQAVPEPTSLAAIGLVGATLLRRRRSC